jgi:tetratricopeptide (TPR) repeat protein
MADLSSGQQTLTIEQYLELGLRHHTAGRLPEAEGMYQRILQSDPNQPAALHLLGVIAHQVGKNDVAVDLITKAVSVKPDYAEAHNNLGNVLNKLQRPEEAVASYHRAIAINPDYAEAHNNLGNALKEQGRLEEAVASYRKAIAIDADCADAHNNLGIVHEEQGWPDDAIARYRNAISIDPDRVEVHYNLGNALVKQGRFDEAVASYRKVIASQPGFAQAHNNIGAAFYELNNMDEAAASYQKALEINPNFADAHKNLGDCFVDLGNLDEAIAHYRNAIAANPDCVEAYNGLGLAFHQLGRGDEAIASYRKALVIMPTNAVARVALAINSWIHAQWEECINHNDMLSNLTEEPFTRRNTTFVFPFHLLLKKLTEARNKNPLKFTPFKNLPVLFTIGESHCLPPAHTTVHLNDRDYRAEPKIIFGCKAWHLGNASKNKYKDQFERIANSLASGATAVVMFGEIDCRLDQGILRHHKKTGGDLPSSIRDLVESYVDYVTKILGPRGITPIFYGVPAPIDEVYCEPAADQSLLNDVIEEFNKMLAKESGKRGLHFLDVYALTLAADEQYRKQIFLESMHMHPSVLGRLTQQL